MKLLPGLLLNNRGFRLLWLGQICSQCGDRLTQLVLVALVAERAAGSTLSLAKVMAATSLPALLLNPFAGAYVDRWDRKRTMIVCDWIRAGVIAALPWAAEGRSLVPLYVGVFLLFAVGSFFVPARLAMIPDLVPSDQLAQANALFTSSGMIGSTLILLIGAFLVEWAGPVRACWVNASSYVASAWVIASIVRGRTGTPPARASTALVFREILEGIRALWGNRRTRRVVGLMGFLMAAAGSSMVVATVLVQQSLGSVTKDLGILSLWLGVGMLLGALVYGRWGIRLSKGTVLGTAFLGCGLAVWAFVMAVMGLRSGVAASAAAVFLGLWVAPVGIVANTLVHEGHPERLHGRIFSSMGVVVNLALILSMLAAGWLTERGGRGGLLVLVGWILGISGVGMLCYTKVTRRRIDG